MKNFKILTVITAAFILSACGGSVSMGERIAESMPVQNQLGLSAVTEAREASKPTEADYELTCEQLDERIAKLNARYEELTAAYDKKQNKGGFLKGLAKGVAKGAFGVAAGQAGVQGLNVYGDGTTNVAGIQAATGLAEKGLDKGLDKVLGEDKTTEADNVKHMTEVKPIAYRLSALNRVKVEKCVEQ